MSNGKSANGRDVGPTGGVSKADSSDCENSFVIIVLLSSFQEVV